MKGVQSLMAVSLVAKYSAKMKALVKCECQDAVLSMAAC